MTRKRCGKCRKPRSLSNFATDNNRPDGKYPYCKECQAKYAKLWWILNHERELQKSRRRQRTPTARRQKRQYHLRTKYGLTTTEYQAMRRKQKGLCLICQEYFGNKLVVDHNHKTGEVRGLLCNGCNSGLGLFERGRAMIKRILKYLSV